MQRLPQNLVGTLCVQADRAPISTDDQKSGILVGLQWQDNSVSPANRYVCVDQTIGAAVWRQITGAGGGGIGGSITATQIGFGDATANDLTSNANFSIVGEDLFVGNLGYFNWADTNGFYAALGADGSNNLTLFGTSSTGTAIAAMTLPLAVDSPTLAFSIPVTITGSTAALSLEAQDSRSANWIINNPSGALELTADTVGTPAFAFGANGLMQVIGNEASLVFADQDGTDQAWTWFANNTYCMLSGGSTVMLTLDNDGNLYIRNSAIMQALTVEESYGYSGLAAMSSGTVNVANINLTNANCRIQVTSQSDGVVGALRVVITDSVGFEIKSSVSIDAGNVAYLITKVG